MFLTGAGDIARKKVQCFIFNERNQYFACAMHLAGYLVVRFVVCKYVRDSTPALVAVLWFGLLWRSNMLYIAGEKFVYEKT